MVLVLNIPVIYILLGLNLRGVEITFVKWFYFVNVVMGYYVLPLFLTTAAILFIFSPLKRLLVIPIGAIITILVYYLLIDSIVFKVAKIHIDLFWLEWIIKDYKGFGLPASAPQVAFLLLLGVVAVEIGIFVTARRIRKPKYLTLMFTLLTVLGLVLSQVIHAVAHEKNDIRITSLTPHLPVYIPVTSYKNAVKYGGLLAIGESYSGNITMESQSSLTYPLSDMKYNLPPDKKLPNIVIIILESWRFDMMNELVTPNIFALSQRSSVFHKHFCSGNSTVAGIFGLFYGLHATYWTAVKANCALIDNPVLIDVLREYQYTFGIFAKSNFKRHKIKDVIFRGIEVHESFTGRTTLEQDKDMTKQLISFLREQKEKPHPLMALAFFKSNHAPYRYPKEDSIFLPAKDLNLVFTNDDTDPECYLNDYRNSTHYVDALVGDIVQQLDSLGNMANTIIIVTTDHGESFNDNNANYWGHGTNFTQYQTRVPLILYTPGKKPQRIEYATSHIDIAPTLLQEYLGCTSNIQDYSNGINMFEKPTDPRPFVIGNYVNHAFIIEDNVFEISPMITKKYKLYDITQKASRLSPYVRRTLLEEISRFYDDSGTAEDAGTDK